jgi:hypothetical protein
MLLSPKKIYKIKFTFILNKHGSLVRIKFMEIRNEIDFITNGRSDESMTIEGEEQPLENS